jgi:uncharacterized 2Fe-2S/4Fe-4S cluster protein (DUF4445 family)
MGAEQRPERVRIQLQPLGVTCEVERGAPLHDQLFVHGVEFPCGGKGRCKGCRVRVLRGALPITPEDEKMLGLEDLAAGWRLACRSRAETNLTLELAQWEVPILADDSRFEFTPREGLGIAVDLGTTTLVAQLVDLGTGHVLSVRSALNGQARYGADVMSRVEFVVAGRGQKQLEQIIRRQIGRMVSDLIAAAKVDGNRIRDVVLVGNTVMHHLFCGLALEPLSHYPFVPSDTGMKALPASELGWTLPADTAVRFLPCLGGFVGSDILAGVVATKLGESEELVGLVDLGTNGEIVVGNRGRLLCASTAAGPAFEGARISMGMRASTGAITEVCAEQGRLTCRVFGNGGPRGLCGSGLVDAVAAGLDSSVINPSGRFANGRREWVLAPPVTLNQNDIRELQLAKAAIAAGIRILLERWGATKAEVSRVFLAGAFGNYINRGSAQRIGLLDFPTEKIQSAGNTALLGAKMALFNLEDGVGFCSRVAEKIEHLPLSIDPRFQEVFVDEMTFPQPQLVPLGGCQL